MGVKIITLKPGDRHPDYIWSRGGTSPPVKAAAQKFVNERTHWTKKEWLAAVQKVNSPLLEVDATMVVWDDTPEVNEWGLISP